jgi:two-component system, OmpR family, phosphate regulon sensor histidine kinase PhoR
MPSLVSTGRRTLTGRLLLWHATAAVAILLVLGVVIDELVERYFVDRLTDSLASQARTVQETLSGEPPEQRTIVALGRAMGARISVIREDGDVLADSEQDPATLENHRGRPEVRQALGGEIGVASRDSASVGIPYHYVAVPPRDGLIVRVAVPLTEVRSELRTIRLALVVGFGLAAVAGLVVLVLIARSVSRPLREVTSAVEQVGLGDLGVEVPERGTEELVLLARTVNRMRGEVSERIETVELEQLTREAILSALDEGVVLFEAGGRALYQNETASRLLNGPIHDARQLMPGPLRDLVREAFRGTARRTIEVASGESSRTLVATAVPLHEEGHALLVVRDVTEARTVEAVRRDFVANASHELKTPVASIRALAETIETAAEDDRVSVRRFARQLEHEAVRLSRVVSDLLDLSRLEGETGRPSEVRLDELARDEANRYRDRAERSGLTLAVTAEEPVRVNGSARDLGLMIRNLVENAVQYTRPGGRVDVVVSGENGVATVEVRDTGPGIPRRDQARIFERFYRVDRARSRETGGTGLGLSIVKHVAENHGGRVTLQSELGRGSTFVVQLPVANAGQA